MATDGININPNFLNSSSVNDMSEYHTADSSIKRNFMIAITLIAIAAIAVGSVYLKKGHPLAGRCMLIPGSALLGLMGATTLYHAIKERNREYSLPSDKNKSSSPTLESHEERTPLNTTNRRNSEINSRSSSRIDWVGNDEEYARDRARKQKPVEVNYTPTIHSSSYYEALLANLDKPRRG